LIRVTDFSSLEREGPLRRSAVTIGNFDGCHLGHQQLLAAARRYAAALEAQSVAVTFRPRPEAFFKGLAAEPLLFTEEQKTRALAELAIAYQVAQPFDLALSSMGYEAFYESCLKTILGAVALVVGDNFRFGQGRQGNAAFLADRGRADGLEVTIGEAAQWAGERISSSRVRAALRADGDVTAATAMLGRPYMLEGVIAQGDQLGRQLGVPTANLEDVSQLLPRYGIYAGYVWLAAPARSADRPPVMHLPSDAIPAVFSFGIRPTLKSEHPPVRLEAHLLAGTYGLGELYGRRAGYYLTHHLRDELTFANLDELKARIAQDIDEAKRVLSGKS